MQCPYHEDCQTDGCCDTRAAELRAEIDRLRKLGAKWSAKIERLETMIRELVEAADGAAKHGH